MNKIRITFNIKSLYQLAFKRKVLFKVEGQEIEVVLGREITNLDLIEVTKENAEVLRAASGMQYQVSTNPKDMN